MPVAIDPKPVAEDFLPTVAGRPDKFLVPDNALAKQALSATKWLFDIGKTTEPYTMSPLPELLIEGFDAEQVWEQVRLQSEPMTTYLSSAVSGFIDGRKRKRGIVADEEEEDEVVGDQEVGEDGEDEYDYEAMLEAGASGELNDFVNGGLEGSDDSEEEDDGADLLDDLDEDADLDEEEGEGSSEREDEEEEGEEGLDGQEEDADQPPRRRGRRTEVDDDFFSLEEMEKFADFGEERDMRKAKKANGEGEDEEGDDDDEFTIGDDLLAMDPEEWDDSDAEMENANDITYEEFFGPREREERARVSFSDRNNVRRFNREDPIEEGQDDEEAAVDAMDEEAAEDDEESGKTIAERVNDLFSSLADETSTEELSTFEKQQLKLQKSIEELESEAVAAKPWTLKGEVSSKARPSNSLLEEDLEIDYAAKPVPVITEESTATLEDMIRQRIKDQLFDDVVRKAPIRDREYDPNVRRGIDEEKSGKSLAELYEADYIKQTGGPSSSSIPTEKDEALQKQHHEISELFQNLCQNLDALSNFHYTPKPAKAELEILPAPTVPAIQMEEVTPAAVSDATLIAPREAYTGSVQKSQQELDSTEKRKNRQREKRKVKRVRTERAKERAAIDAAKPEGQKRVESEKRGKERALEQLMGQGNVTVVEDKRSKG
ncbi:u3 small nucleolar ribonucleoprotein MPP10, partial [Rhizophlyctis rosea]